MLSKLITRISTMALLFVGIYLLQANTEYCILKPYANKPQVDSTQHLYWTIDELSDSLANLSAKELVFIKESSMEGAYVELNKGSSFKRKAMNDDLYYLYTGSCTVQLGNHRKSFAAGDVIYVKKGSELTIENSDEFLQLVIVSMYLKSNSTRPTWKHYSKKSMESSRSSKENMWNPFIMYSNVMLGLYMLPYSLDGDQRLVHEWQELNIVTAGSSKFIMDSGTIDVAKGSIFFVEEGNGHYFEELNDNIDILILWEMRNVDHSKH